MKGREFLEASAAAALLAGCGGGGGSSAAEPDTLRVSRADVHAADGNGVVYRATPTANVVSRLGAGGATVWTTGSRGRGPAQFDHPTALAADDRGRVLVVDRGNSRVQMLDGDSGRLLGSFGSPGSGAEQFNGPRQIAVALDRIHVVDQFNHRVSVFDLDGRPLFAIGGFGIEGGGLNVPRGVAVDAAGNVYVCDSTGEAIKRYSSSGIFESRIDGANVEHPGGLAFDAHGDLWVADGVGGRIVVLSVGGAVLRTLVTPLPDGRPGAPIDIALAGRDIHVRAVVNGA